MIQYQKNWWYTTRGWWRRTCWYRTHAATRRWWKSKKVEEANELKVLPWDKLLIRLPVLLAETKSENNSYKLTNDIRKVFYLLYQKINK